MGWFGKLIGTDKAVDSLLDTEKGLLVRAGGWLGNLNYTAEEKAEADGQTREWGIRQLEAMAPFKVVQRILAFAAAGLWGFIGLNVVLAIWIDNFTGTTDITTDMFALATSDYIFWPVCVVFALYFAGGVLPRGGDKK